MISEEDQRQRIERVEAEIVRVEEQIANASAKIEEHGGPLAENAAVVYWIKKEEQLRKEKELLLELQLENAKGTSL